MAAWVALAALADRADARVFQRWSAVADARRTLQTAGGRIAYEADIALNGGKGRLCVAAFEENMPSVARRLSQSLGQPIVAGGGGLTVRTVENADGVLRLVLFALPAYGRTLAVTVSQTAAEAAASARPPERHLLDEVPAYAPSTPRFFCRDEEFQMAVAVAETPDSARTAAASYSAALAAAGWQPVPPVDPRRGGALGVYARGADLCIAFVNERDPRGGGGSIIAVLHKRRSVK